MYSLYSRMNVASLSILLYFIVFSLLSSDNFPYSENRSLQWSPGIYELCFSSGLIFGCYWSFVKIHTTFLSHSLFLSFVSANFTFVFSSLHMRWVGQGSQVSVRTKLSPFEFWLLFSLTVFMYVKHRSLSV